MPDEQIESLINTPAAGEVLGPSYSRFLAELQKKPSPLYDNKTISNLMDVCFSSLIID